MLIQLKKQDWQLVKELNKGRFSLDLLKKSFDAMVKSKLRYNTLTGITYVRGENVAEYTHKSDIPKDYSGEDVIEWIFMPEINNGSSRLSRGYDVIG